MLKFKKILYFLFNNPLRILVYFLIKVLPKELVKKKLFYHNSIKDKLFLLSFDCDTQKDIDCLEKLIQKLNFINLKIVLAIPGELVINNFELIKNLKNKYSIEFLNHGYYLHTKFNDKEKAYKPIFSYEKKNIEFIKKDIELAHNLFKDQFNIDLKGFRAPHFGDINFNKKKKIYKFLKKLGYSYYSSTIYDLAFLKGAIFLYEGIVEISVTGCADKPVLMLDTWSFLKMHNDKLILSSNYLAEIEKLQNILENKNFNFVNIYADPSHVIENENFFQYLKNFSKFNLSNFKDIDLIKNKL